MNFYFLLFFIIKSISSKTLIQSYSQLFNSSTDIIKVFPYEKIKVTQKDNSPLYFCFSTNSLFEENNTFVFDFYKGFSEYSELFIYLNYNNFLNDKQNGNFNNANYKGIISNKVYGYDALQLGFTIKKIENIYFAIQNKNEKNRQFIFNIYDYSYLINITNSFYNDFHYQYSLFYKKKIYMLLKYEKPIYFIYQFHSNKTTILGNTFKLIFYKNNLNNKIKELTSSYTYSHELYGYLYIEDKSNYYLTIETSFLFNSSFDHFYFSGYYSNVPYLVYSLDNNESNFNYSFITENNIYYYKNISNYDLNENFEFELFLYDSENNQLLSKPIGLYVYNGFNSKIDVYDMPKIRDYTLINKKNGHLMFSIKKKSKSDNFIIISISNSNYNYLQEIKGNIKYIIPIETHYFRNFMIILIIIILIILIIYFCKKIIPNLKNKINSNVIDNPINNYTENTYPPMIQTQNTVQNYLPTPNEIDENSNFNPAPSLDNKINTYPAPPNNFYDKPTQGYS